MRGSCSFSKHTITRYALIGPKRKSRKPKKHHSIGPWQPEMVIRVVRCGSVTALHVTVAEMRIMVNTTQCPTTPVSSRLKTSSRHNYQPTIPRYLVRYADSANPAVVSRA